MLRGPVLLECQGVGANPWRDRPATRSDRSTLRSCMRIGAWGPNVDRNWSLGLVNIDMIRATPPTKSLLKPNNFKALLRSQESSVSSACGPRFTGSMTSFCARAVARRWRDSHKSWISVLRVRWQWPSGPVYESMRSVHPVQTCLHLCSSHMLSSVAGRV